MATLSGMVDEVVLAMDADEAGEEAMLRAQRVAAGRKMRLLVARMPASEDPAEILAGDGGAERFREMIEAAVEVSSFQVGLVLDRTDVGSPAERDRALNEVAPILAAMGETVTRDELIRLVADRLDLEPAMVMGRMVAATPASGGDPAGRARDGGPTPQRPAAVVKLTSRERRERALLAMCIALPSEGMAYLEKLDVAHLSATGARAVGWLRQNLADPASNLPREDEELGAIVAELVMKSREEPASAKAMEFNFMQLDLRRLEDEIADAAGRGDYERRTRLSGERALLVERIAHAAPRRAAARRSRYIHASSGSAGAAVRGSSIGRAFDC